MDVNELKKLSSYYDGGMAGYREYEGFEALVHTLLHARQYSHFQYHARVEQSLVICYAIKNGLIKERLNHFGKGTGSYELTEQGMQILTLVEI